MEIKTLRVFNTNLKQIKRRLLSIQDSLEEYEYWKNENSGVLKLVQKDIQHHYEILEERIIRGKEILE